MRLIDADALIDDIKNHLWDWETVNGITAQTVLKQTITDIENQPTASPWRRVKEELPDNSRDVIIFTASKIIGVGSFIRPNWYQWYSGGGIPVDVTYWMPLPEPPKEGE